MNALGKWALEHVARAAHSLSAHVLVFFHALWFEHHNIPILSNHTPPRTRDEQPVHVEPKRLW